MAYLDQSQHRSFVGLVLGFVGWILTSSLSGINDWRIWYWDDESGLSGGLAWVGVWRACFNSHVLDKAETCRSIGLTEAFTPPEIAAAQVLCMAAIGLGSIANLVAGFAVRKASVGGRGTLAFVVAGMLYWVTATCSLVPVLWNMSSVLSNRTIDFPSDFLLPPAPVRQEVGAVVGIGILSSLVLIFSGLLLLCNWNSKTEILKSANIDNLEDPRCRVDEFLDNAKESEKDGWVNLAFEYENI